MKARQIQARFWDDEFVVNATWQSRFVFIYLCTCLPINMSGIFQLSVRKIIFETGLAEDDFEIAKEELSINKKVFFHDGWVLVVNAFKNCKVWKSKSNWSAWQEEWSKVSEEMRQKFNTDVGSDVYTSQKQEIENIKQETENSQSKPYKWKEEKQPEEQRMMTSEETAELKKWADSKVD